MTESGESIRSININILILEGQSFIGSNSNNEFPGADCFTTWHGFIPSQYLAKLTPEYT